MTREWYQNMGFKISVEQALIDRAERDIMAAYIAPILPVATIEDSGVQMPAANLVYLLLLRRSLCVTRKGAKTKNDERSTQADDTSILEEQSAIAAMSIKQLRGLQGARADAKVTDIAGIYFLTHIIGK